MSVDRCQSEVGSREFSEWMAWDRMQPIGMERLDLLAGVVASVIANVNVRKGRKGFSPADFMPKYAGEQPRRQSKREMYMRMCMWAHSHNSRLGADFTPGGLKN